LLAGTDQNLDRPPDLRWITADGGTMLVEDDALAAELFDIAAGGAGIVELVLTRSRS